MHIQSMVSVLVEIEGVFIIKPCEDPFNICFCHAILKKLRINVPNVKLIQEGELKYEDFKTALNVLEDHSVR